MEVSLCTHPRNIAWMCYFLTVTDHLESVRGVTDTDGNELQTLDYYPYGQVTEKSVSSSGYALNNIADSLDDVSQPYRFNGKESQEFAWIPYLDYGARYYSPDATRWTTMDPLAEKYYFISPYAFCSNNPVNFAIKREQNEQAHFAEREQRKALRGLTLLIRMENDGSINMGLSFGGQKVRHHSPQIYRKNSA